MGNGFYCQVSSSSMAKSLLALKRNAESVTCFDGAMALQGTDWGAWKNKGLALSLMEQYAAALPPLEKAPRLGGTRCPRMIALGRDRSIEAQEPRDLLL
jgi:hypothetical protein